ncbi:MAG: hypothetical protein OXF41_01195 [bacterium]|nr:hypothetical protein [bacterium]
MTVLVDAFTVTATEPTEMLLYPLSVLVAAWVMLDVPVATPVTVNDWGVFQFDDVNTRLAGATVALSDALLVGVIVTLWVGCDSNLTVYVVVSPTSTERPVWLTATAAVSSSVMVKVTPDTDRPDTLVVNTIVSLPSSMSSLTIITVPVADFERAAISNADGRV